MKRGCWKRPPLIDRLLDRSVLGAEQYPGLGRCFLYTAHPAQPRPQIWVDSVSRRLTHAAHELFVGPIPDDLFALHRCDVERCWRPSHLFLGTKSDNAADRDAKERQARGERQGSAKLTTKAVREIRASSALLRELAAQYGVSEQTISAVRHRKTWRHV